MSTPASDDPLGRLRRDLGLKPLSHGWAKTEIFLGLAVAVAGLFGGMHSVAYEARMGEPDAWTAWVGHGALVTLGGYLALAGHRSHLYQSNNRLAAHLAELIRNNHTTPPGKVT